MIDDSPCGRTRQISAEQPAARVGRDEQDHEADQSWSFVDRPSMTPVAEKIT